MADQQWENLKEIFHAAIALPPRERSAYLERVCGPDSELRAAVDSLLRSHEQTNNFVDEPAYKAVADLLTKAGEFSKGKLVGHYRIVSLLGEGGMGRVYLAEDTKLYRKVSLKFLSKNFTQDEDRLRRFEQEARAVSTLNHPNILTIHEIGEEDGNLFIATEFIEGQTLRQRLSQPLEIEDALEIALQVASALVAAHRVNIIHRDIKPENIMIRGDDNLVKVLDFGLAKKSSRSSNNLPIGSDIDTALTANTSPGVIIGTVSYMSPEQARGDIVDERTDIWSLGVVLYEMVAGCSPFAAATSNEIISAILSRQSVPPLARYSRLVPERLEEIVEKALTKNRDERYQTSKDLLIDLKRLKQSVETKAAIERSTSPERVGLQSSSEQSNDAKTASHDGRLTLPQSPSSAEYVVNQVKTHKRGLVFTMLILLTAVITGVIIHGWRTKPAVAAQPEIKSLAVLPLKSLDSREDYLGVGIADAVIRRISQTDQLTVRPTSAVLKYLKEDTDSLSAARQLQVDSVLEGNVQRSNDRLRVSVNLLRVSDGSSMWTDNFDMTTADIFLIQDKVAEKVAARLRLHSDSTPAGLMAKYPTTPIAYEFYVKGIFSLDERDYGEEAMPQMQTTIDFLKKAIEADPNYAAAHAQLAFADVWTALFIEPENSHWVESARKEIQRSNELDPNISEAHLANGLLLWSDYGGYQNDAALRELLLAKQLNPNSNHGELAGTYGHIGLEDQASRELQRGLEVDPTSQSLKDLTIILPYLSAKPDEWLSARQKIAPSTVRPNAWYFLRKGNLEEAQKAIDEQITRRPDSNEVLMQQALLLALKGDSQHAQSQVPGILAKISLHDQSRHHSTYDAACIYALAGNSSESVRWLKETAASGFPNYPLFERDPFLDRIRQAPEFVQFMADQKAQWEKYRQEFGD